jgi:predicted N-acetyltransferase YhbS
MSSPGIVIRPAKQADLEAINRVIEAAVMTWNLPQRVRRLALPSYRYTNLDLDHLEVVVAEDDQHNVVGVAAWGQADAKDAPPEHTALLLHGIYVDPPHQQRGIGRELFRTAEKAVRKHQYGGLLVKAQEAATGFFLAQGMSRLGVKDPARHYANRFWKRADE